MSTIILALSRSSSRSSSSSKILFPSLRAITPLRRISSHGSPLATHHHRRPTSTRRTPATTFPSLRPLTRHASAATTPPPPSSLPHLYHDALDDYELALDSTTSADGAAYAAADRAAALDALQKLRVAFEQQVPTENNGGEREAWAERIAELERWNEELARRAGKGER